MLLICSDDKAAAPAPKADADTEAIVQGHMRVAEDLRQAGKMVVGERLRPDSEASRLRLKAGQRQVMDGPFAETKEALGGFYLIECDTEEEAVEWAKKIPLREGGSSRCGRSGRCERRRARADLPRGAAGGVRGRGREHDLSGGEDGIPERRRPCITAS
jgi:hypothetical protein